MAAQRWNRVGPGYQLGPGRPVSPGRGQVTNLAPHDGPCKPLCAILFGPPEGGSDVAKIVPRAAPVLLSLTTRATIRRGTSLPLAWFNTSLSCPGCRMWGWQPACHAPKPVLPPDKANGPVPMTLSDFMHKERTIIMKTALETKQLSRREFLRLAGLAG